MITVVIPTLNAEAGLAASLTALVPAVVDGVVRQVIVIDAGSTDRTCEIAEQAGCDVMLNAAPNRGAQLHAGAELAKGQWLLFLHADTVLETGWHTEVSAFMNRVVGGERPMSAAAFRLALDDLGFKPRLIEFGVMLRCTLFRLPYGDQGLLIPAQFYRRLGGFRPLSLMEDVDFVGRIPRAARIILRARATTSAIRYKRDGYARRVARNALCLTLYLARLPVSRIERIYRG